MRTVIAFVSSVLVALVATVSPLADQETHKGTVVSVEVTGGRVDVAGARIQKGDAIAVTVDHDLDESLAFVVRLGTTK